MTEEEFWHSNPRIIKVWEEAWKEEQNRQNKLVHLWFGNYGISAVSTALSLVLTPMFCEGKKSQAKYIEEPVRIFEMTEQEKLEYQKMMDDRFVAWGNALIKRYKKPDS